MTLEELMRKVIGKLFRLKKTEDGESAILARMAESEVQIQSVNGKGEPWHILSISVEDAATHCTHTMRYELNTMEMGFWWPYLEQFAKLVEVTAKLEGRTVRVDRS